MNTSQAEAELISEHITAYLPYETERAVIATFLFADMSQIEHEIRSTELKEEWFKDLQFKLIAHAINHLKETGFYDELTVKDYLSTDHRFNIQALESCLIANIAGSKQTLEAWIAILSRNNLANIEGI